MLSPAAPESERTCRDKNQVTDPIGLDELLHAVDPDVMKPVPFSQWDRSLSNCILVHR